jgi:hypothetical protein
MSYGNDHDHRGEYAAERHDHDLDYAEKHHRHYDLETDDKTAQQAITCLRVEVAELRRQLGGAIAQLRVLDRLRPTCVRCMDAPADRQTTSGPACPDCAGDLPDGGPDPDRPETWAFGEAPVPPARPDEDQAGQRCPETGDGAHTAGWHDGGRCGACGQDGPEPEPYGPHPEIDEDGRAERRCYVMPEDYGRGRS